MFFHKTVNATGEVQNAEFIYGCISKVVEDEIGSKCIIQIVMDNGSNYKRAYKMLIAKHRHITWQLCAAHTINLMLKHIGRFNEVEHVVNVGVVPNSLQDIGRASDGAKRRPVKAEGWAGAYIYTLVRVSWRLDSLVNRRRRVTQNS
jgi:hypothetical protein